MNRRTVLAIAQAERRRDRHRYAATRSKRALAVLAIAVLLPLLGLIVLGAHSLGQRVGGGETAVLRLARWYLPGTIFVFVFLGALNAGRRLLQFEARRLLLTAVPTRDLVAGLLLAESTSWLGGVVGPSLVLVVVFALGTGSPFALVAGSFAMGLLAVTCLLVGIALGLAARVVLQRVPLSSSARSLLGSGATIAGALVAGGAGALLGARGAEAEDIGLASLAPNGPPPVPVGYYADWLFVGTPVVEGVSLAATASLLGVVLTLPVALVAIHRLLPRLWYADPALPDQDATVTPAPDSEAEDSAHDMSHNPWQGQTRTGVVTAGLLTRAVRTPARFAHVGYYALVVGVLAVSAIANPEAAGVVVGSSLVLLGLWLAGGLFGLNPLGEEGAMLGQLVLSTTPARTFVRARLLAGLIVALPLIVLGTVTMVFGGVALDDGLVLAGFWSLLALVSATAALGIGTHLPRTQPGAILDAVDTVPPEPTAQATHAVVVGVLSVVGAAGLVFDLDMAVRGPLLVAVTLCSVLLADGGYRYAVGGLASYGRTRRGDVVFALELAAGLAMLGLLASTAVSLAVQVFVPVSGVAGFVLAFVASYAGYLAVVVAYVYGSGNDWGAVGLRRLRRADLASLTVGLTASFGVYGLLLLAATWGGVPVAQHSLGGEIASGGPAVALALVGLALFVNAPVEELLFRGVVQQRLAAVLSEPTAIGLAAGVFALAHLPVYSSGSVLATTVTLTSLGALGGIWGWVYTRTGSVVPAALCHGLYNAALFGVAYVSVL